MRFRRFWIDMSLLYEHYVLGALRKAYGPKILYQANVTTGKLDFRRYEALMSSSTGRVRRLIR